MIPGNSDEKDRRGNASGGIMGWHPVNQRLDRVYPDGPVDLQSGGLAVSGSV